MALLGVVVVLGDLRAELDLADRDLLLVLARLLQLLRLLVLVLRVVEHAADGRLGLGRHLDEVEVALLGVAQRVVDLQDADLLAVLPDQADLRYPDALVDPGRIALGRAPVESTRDRHYRSRGRVKRTANAACWVLRRPRAGRIASYLPVGERSETPLRAAPLRLGAQTLDEIGQRDHAGVAAAALAHARPCPPRPRARRSRACRGPCAARRRGSCGPTDSERSSSSPRRPAASQRGERGRGRPRSGGR